MKLDHYFLHVNKYVKRATRFWENEVETKKKVFTIGVARILDWGAQTRNHIGEVQKKKRVFTVRFRICDWGGGRNLVGDQFWIEGGPNLKLRSGDQTQKTTELKISTSWKAYFVQKLGEDQKKGLHGLRSSHKPDLERVLKTTSLFWQQIFHWLQGNWGGGACPLATPMVFTGICRVFVPEITWRPKKDERSSSAQMQIIAKLLGGGEQSNYWGVYPPGYRHPWLCSSNLSMPLSSTRVRGVAKDGGTLFRTKTRRRPKKRSSLQNEWVFGPKVCEDQKKRSSPKNPKNQ